MSPARLPDDGREHGSPAPRLNGVRRQIATICLRSLVSRTPPYSYSNEDIAAALGLNAVPRVCRRIGIQSRRTFLPLDVRAGRVVGASNNSELEIAEQIGNEAIDSAGIERDDIVAFCLISCTVQHGRRVHFELASHDLVRRLRLDPSVSRFEIDAGCDGFVRALHVIRRLFRIKKDEHALIVVTSMPSLYFDRRQCARLPSEAQFPNYVFGDGAAAAIISNGDSPGLGIIRSSWAECDSSVQLGWTCLSQTGETAEIAYAIDYKAVASSYVPAIARAVRNLPEHHPIVALGGLERVYFHQANGILPFAAAEELGIPSGKIAMIAHDRGNLAAAAIPTMLAEDLANNILSNTGTALLAAVGAGLSCSAVLLERRPANP